MNTDDSVTLRRMRWWDLPEVVALDAQLFDDTAWTSTMFWSELAAVPQTRDYLVLESGGDAEIVGYGGVMTVAGEATVQTLGVAWQRQRHGLGRQLLEALIACARRRHASMVWLEVRDDNAAAHQLYASAGFEREAERADYYGIGRPALIMRKRLTGPAVDA
jgi:[ribosomal protein S18]-alanine N-acetyltransferase